MAYAVKYIFSWQSTNGTDREIRVLKDGHTGDPIRRALGRGPILKKQKSGTVCGTSLEFYPECAVDGEFAEFYTSDPKAYRVELYAGNTLLWTGYVTPELYSEPDVAPPYDVQVVATDGIGELKLYDFTAQGTVTLRALLGVLLAYTGLSSDVNLISSLKPGSGGAGSLLSKSINLDFMAGKSCYEVLTYILDTLHATITWYRGAWLITRETNVTMTSGKVRYFNTSGNSALFAGSSVMIGGAYDSNAWPVGNLTQIIDPAKKSVTIQAPWHPVRGLENPDMDRDASWTKNSGATFASSPGCFSLPYLGVNAQGLACIKQDLQMAGIRVPLSLSLKGTGLGRIQYGDPRTPDWTNGFVGVVLVYTVGQTHYILRSVEDGLEWREGALPNFDLFYWQQPGGGEGIPTKSFDSVLADRIGAEVLTVENIPTFDQSGSFPAGVLTVYIAGLNCYLYGAELNVVLPKGYKDRLHLDNGARGEGEEIEVAIGRETSAIEYYKNFLQGILLDGGALITSFSDANFTTALDFLSFIARDYALSRALPRLKQTGKLYLESGVDFPPLVFTKGALDYWLETYAWDLYEDEVEVSALSLPGGTLTVQGETVSEAGGTASSSGASSAGGGSSSMAGVGTTVNFFEQDADYSGEVKLKAGYNGLRIPGLRLGAGASALDLEVVTIDGTRYLHTPLSFYSDGQLSGGGLSQSSPGGGGGGLDPALMWKYLTNDPTLPSNPYANTKIAEAHLPDLNPGTGISASYSGNLYLNLSLNYSAVAGQLGLSGMAYKPANQQTIIDALGYTPANATALNDYVLKAGDTMSGGLTINAGGFGGQLVLNRNNYGGGDIGIVYMNNGTLVGYLGITDQSVLFFKDPTQATGVFYTILHSGNFVAGTNYQTPIPANTYAPYNSAGYLPLSAGNAYPITGPLNVYSSGNERANLNLISQADVPNDLYFGSGGNQHWSLSSRDSTDGNLFILYSTTYGTTVRVGHTNGIWNFATTPTVSNNTIYHAGNSNKSDVPWSCSTLNASSSVSSSVFWANPNCGIGRGSVFSSSLSQYSLAMQAYDGSGYDNIYAFCNSFLIDGKLGLGTNSPAYKVDIVGDIRASGRVYLAESFDSGISFPNGHGVALNSLNHVLYLGYGYRDAATKLQLDGGTNGILFRVYTNDRMFIGQNNMTIYVPLNVSSSGNARANINLISTANVPNDLYFGSNGTQHWSITSRDSGESNLIAFYSTGGPGYTATIGYSTGYWNFTQRIGVKNANPAHEIDVAGVIHASTGIYTEGYLSGGGLSQSSDQRLKRFIEDFSYTPDLLMALRPREWDWNDKTPMMGHAAGFVAQEVEGLLPYMVDDTREYLALFYDHFHALEVAALQDHETRLAAIEKENAAIRKDNAALRLENRQLRERLNMN